MTRGLPKRTEKGHIANEEIEKRKNDERKGHEDREKQEKEKEEEKQKEKQRGAEREKGKEKEAELRRKPGNAAGNAGVKFDANSKRKLRPAGLRRGVEKTRGSPTRSRKGMKGEAEDSKRKSPTRRERRRWNRETWPRTLVSSLVQVQKENSPKTVPTRPATFRRRAEKDQRSSEQKVKETQNQNRKPSHKHDSGLFKGPQHHSHRNQLSGLYKNSTTEVKVVE